MPEVERQMWLSHSVEQIRALEQKKRQQSEDKKEELRQLIGCASARFSASLLACSLRYRVLIESSDSNMHMKDLSVQALDKIEQVVTSLSSLEKRDRNAWLGAERARLYVWRHSSTSFLQNRHCWHKSARGTRSSKACGASLARRSRFGRTCRAITTWLLVRAIWMLLLRILCCKR